MIPSPGDPLGLCSVVFGILVYTHGGSSHYLNFSDSSYRILNELALFLFFFVAPLPWDPNFVHRAPLKRRSDGLLCDLLRFVGAEAGEETVQESLVPVVVPAKAHAVSYFAPSYCAQNTIFTYILRLI